jgi:hypothetical protein
MSNATEALQRAVDEIDQEIGVLEARRERHVTALGLLEDEDAPSTDEDRLEAMNRAAGRANVDRVRSALRTVARMSQRDLAAHLDLAPGSVSKAVHALEAAGQAFPAGKEGRSPLWTTKKSQAVTVGDPW